MCVGVKSSKQKLNAKEKEEEEGKGTEKGEKEEVWWGRKRRLEHRYNYLISRQAVVWPASQSRDETDTGACPWFAPQLTDALM